MSDKILVTGGAGFIGSHVVDLLVSKGHEVVILDNLSSGIRENINSKAKFYEEDLKNYKNIEAIFENEKFNIVFHLAAQIDVRKSVEDPIEDAKINVIGSLNLINLCQKYGVGHFIFSSTGGAIYGNKASLPTNEDAEKNPLSPYGCAKLSVEKYLNFYSEVHGLKSSILRYSNVYGPRQNYHGEAGVIAIFLNNMLCDKKSAIYGGVQTRDFVYVGDVARANLMVLEGEGGIYNVGTGIETDIIGIFGKLNKFFKYKFEAEYGSMKKGEQMKSCLDFKKINEVFGWKPEVELDNGLCRTYNWFANKSGN